MDAAKQTWQSFEEFIKSKPEATTTDFITIFISLKPPQTLDYYEGALKDYLKAVCSCDKNIDLEQIKRNIKFFIRKKGARINAAQNPESRTFLQIAVAGLSQESNDAYKQNATKAAIALLENSAGFSLSQEEQVDLVKNILKFYPDYIKTLISKKFYIAKNFQIDGVTLAQYARAQNVAAEIVQFIEDQPEKYDHVARKKRIVLERPLIIEKAQTTELDVKRRIVENIAEGNSIKKNNAEIFTAKDGSGEYLVKRENFSRIIANDYGSKLLRVVSNKEYTIKRSGLTHDARGNWEFAIKIDRAFTQQEDFEKFLSKDGSRGRIESTSFLGGLWVFSEWDANQRNVSFSVKHGRAIGIDLEPFFNGHLTNFKNTAETRIVGSLQSVQMLLKISGAKNLDEKILALLVERRKIYQQKSDEDSVTEEEFVKICSAINDLHKKYINEELLQNIKTNVATDPTAKAEFMAFMGGVERAIAISKDKDFLDALDKKYQQEIGDEAFLEAKKCRAALALNAAESEKLFKKYLEFYRQLCKEKSTNTPSSSNRQNRVGAENNDGDEIVAAPEAGTQRNNDTSRNEEKNPSSSCFNFGRLFRRKKVAQIADDGNTRE